jgi:hypothetical protein
MPGSNTEHTVENLTHPFECRAALASFGHKIGPNNIPFLVRPNAADLSDRLAESKGVICPPPTADKDIELRPPPTGDNNMPAPGTPGSPRLQPK